MKDMIFILISLIVLIIKLPHEICVVNHLAQSDLVWLYDVCANGFYRFYTFFLYFFYTGEITIKKIHSCIHNTDGIITFYSVFFLFFK
jgi:hypothetical protein